MDHTTGGDSPALIKRRFQTVALLSTATAELFGGGRGVVVVVVWQGRWSVVVLLGRSEGGERRRERGGSRSGCAAVVFQGE